MKKCYKDCFSKMSKTAESEFLDNKNVEIQAFVIGDIMCVP